MLLHPRRRSAVMNLLFRKTQNWPRPVAAADKREEGEGKAPSKHTFSISFPPSFLPFQYLLSNKRRWIGTGREREREDASAELSAWGWFQVVRSRSSLPPFSLSSLLPLVPMGQLPE